MRNVYLTKTSCFLPNSDRPVSNDEMEKYLGYINGKPSRAKNIVLRNNKIKRRYYALEEGGKITHSNAQLMFQAINGLQGDGFKLEDMDFMAVGTTSPDQLVPSHASMTHGLLGIRPIEISSHTGSCCAGMQAFKFAYLSVLSGEHKKAVCGGSERLSPWLKANYFAPEIEHLESLQKNPIIAFEREFLRWMLSDGAGAFLLEENPNPNRLSLRVEWVDMISYANELETCMYQGCTKQSDGSIIGWAEYKPQEWIEQSLFALHQDIHILEANIAKYGAICAVELCNRRGLDMISIDFFLPHISSFFFKDRLASELNKNGVGIPDEKWFTNLDIVGNIGAGSIYIMLNELYNSDRLQKGQKILLAVPESARFSYGTALLIVC